MPKPRLLDHVLWCTVYLSTVLCGDTKTHGLLMNCPPGNPWVADSYVGIANAFLRPLRSEGLDLEFEGTLEFSCSPSGILEGETL